MLHLEIHYLETARDTALLETAGLPRYGDVEPAVCTACSARTGEVQGQNGTVSWRPFGVLLDGESISVVCGRCMKQIDRALRS